jgi:hypothetical protein
LDVAINEGLNAAFDACDYVSQNLCEYAQRVLDADGCFQ